MSARDDLASALQPPPDWQPLIDSLLEAVCVVEPMALRVVAANAAAEALFGAMPGTLVGRPVIELAATPEDMFFWEDVASGRAAATVPPGAWIHSDSYVRDSDGALQPVERRVGRVWLRPGQAVYVVGLRDQRAQRDVEHELEKLVAELQATLESTADGILVTDLSGAIRGCNRLFAQQWSLPDELLTQRDDAAVHAWLRSQVIDPASYDAQLATIADAPLQHSRDQLVLRDGRILERRTLPQYARGQPIGRVSSFRDITERLAGEAQLRLAAQVFESSLDAIFVTDAEHRIVTVNASCERLAGVPRERLIGRPIDALLHHADEADWFDRVRARLAERGVWEGELWHRRADGGTLPGQVSLVRLAPPADVAPGALGPGVRHVGFFKDLTEMVKDREQIRELARNDPLTRLPNRSTLADKVNAALAMAQRHHTAFALLFLDLDRFKQINDSLGHLYGDRVLVEVARRLQTCVRQVDTVARLGGDEFVLLLDQTDARGAETIARRVIEVLGEPFGLDGMNFSVTASIGIALYPNDGETMNDLVKNADAAMYRVKERGRAGFRFYQPQMNVDLLARMKLDHAMRIALERGDFRLHYQPQVDLASGAVVGAEALLRWRDADLGDISPGEFIPVAEESGFIVALGDWVLRDAVRQAAAWQADGRELLVSINVSALQFQQPGFAGRVAAVLAEHGLPARLLELELTESILIQDADEALARLRALDQLGVQLAIDDFGTGYSSLGYLKRFPIRRLKIDRSFIRGLPGDESDAGIAVAVIQLARALRLRVIAEGVETVAQRDFLREAGCDEFQGFLYAPAMAASDFEKRLKV
ncbi:MAG TPA: EAL domain-containing protein [Methylibium sp.]|nr:EAL domain-containing protein [Methylibium sp.]